MNTSTKISGRAMLATVSVSVWTARKYDRKATAEVAANHNTTGEVGRYNKLLLPGDAVSYKAVTSLAREIRKEHYKQTLPWKDEGARMLPTANFMAYGDMMRGFRAKWDNAVATFLGDYPAMREDARQKLNGLYSDDDYPSIEKLKTKFDLAVNFDPIAEGDFKVELPPWVLEQLEASVTDRIASATASAMKDAWDRLYDGVAHIHERLANPDGIFRDSLIENVAELCEILPRLNVTGDANLDRMAIEVKEKLVGWNPQRLRDNAQTRQQVADDAAAIMKSMAGLYGGAQ